jgi:NADH pyrophosphatase NudC (nudix superfamily)
MTQDEIIEMAREASAGNDDKNIFFEFVIEELEDFAKLVAAKAIAELESQERNFCPRCGKRTNDIHTCTPPQRTLEKNT